MIVSGCNGGWRRRRLLISGEGGTWGGLGGDWAGICYVKATDIHPDIPHFTAFLFLTHSNIPHMFTLVWVGRVTFSTHSALYRRLPRVSEVTLTVQVFLCQQWCHIFVTSECKHLIHGDTSSMVTSMVTYL